MNNLGFTTYTDYRVRFSSKAQTGSRPNLNNKDFGLNRFNGKTSEQPESEESDIKRQEFNLLTSWFGLKNIYRWFKEIYPLISPVESGKIVIEALKDNHKDKKSRHKNNTPSLAYFA